jgi:hypothetical protein
MGIDEDAELQLAAAGDLEGVLALASRTRMATLPSIRAAAGAGSCGCHLSPLAGSGDCDREVMAKVGGIDAWSGSARPRRGRRW